VEPASAIPLACVRKLLQSRELHSTETVVCVVTAAGIKWPDVLARTTPEPPHIPPTIEALERQLAV
jgi:threonine synthase